jgi:hypothetical protein
MDETSYPLARETQRSLGVSTHIAPLSIPAPKPGAKKMPLHLQLSYTHLLLGTTPSARSLSHRTTFQVSTLSFQQEVLAHVYGPSLANTTQIPPHSH